MHNKVNNKFLQFVKCTIENGLQCQGHKAVILKTIYNYWQVKIYLSLHDSLNVTSFLADCDVWIQSGSLYHGNKDILMYTDDLLACCSLTEAKRFLDYIRSKLFGAHVGEYDLPD